MTKSTWIFTVFCNVPLENSLETFWDHHCMEPTQGEMTSITTKYSGLDPLVFMTSSISVNVFFLANTLVLCSLVNTNA